MCGKNIWSKFYTKSTRQKKELSRGNIYHFISEIWKDKIKVCDSFKFEF
jgi:hypothetical protein